jgi:lysophospholipase L1-like esterase
VVIFDAFAVLAADDGLVQPDYALDMLHINRRGYAALNQALADVLTGLAAPQ